MRIGAVLAAMGLSSALIFLATGASAQPSTPEWSPQPPFAFDQNKYVQLHITVTDGAGSKLGRCPKRAPWGADVADYVNRTKKLGVGLKVLVPTLGETEFNPLNLELEAGLLPGLSGNKCKLTVQEVDYTSPLFSMGSYANQEFVVTPSLFKNERPSDNLKEDLRNTLQTLGTLAGVPAPAAASAGVGLGRLVDGAEISVQESFRAPFAIKPSPLNTHREWSEADGVISSTNGYKIRVWMSVVDAFITKPASAAWQPAFVLDTRLAIAPIPGTNTSQTLGGYVSAFAGEQLAAFAGSKPQDVDARCKALRGRLQNLNLTNPDRALLAWALTRTLPAGVTGGQIDSTECMQGEWAYLPSEIKPRSDQAPPPPSVPATTAQMSWVEREKVGIAAFFQTASAEQRVKIAGPLFHYPLPFEGGGSAVTNPSTVTIENNYAWLLRTTAAPMLERLGCYAYFPGGRAGGGDSYMQAIGKRPQSTGGQELLFTFTFEPFVAGNVAIARVDVSTTISPGERRAILLQRDGDASCAGGWAPRMLGSN